MGLGNICLIFVLCTIMFFVLIHVGDELIIYVLTIGVHVPWWGFFFPLIWEAVTNKLQLEVLNVKTVWTCSQANILRSFCQQKKINLQL